MKRIELPLYLKLSTIYNKILQLTIVIVLVLVVLNIHFISDEQSHENIHNHYQKIGQVQLQQLADSAVVIIEQGDRKDLQLLAEQVSSQAFIHDVVFYDVTGQIIAQSFDAKPILQRQSEKVLLVEEGLVTSRTNSETITEFTGEVRKNNLLGYVRITLNDDHIKGTLNIESAQLSEQSRFLILISGLIGFLLSRSFSKVKLPSFKANKTKL